MVKAPQAVQGDEQHQCCWPYQLIPPHLAANKTVGSPRVLHDFFVFWKEFLLRLSLARACPLSSLSGIRLDCS
jgi:hypothetical protein